MCRWALKAPTPFKSILWPVIDPILVTFAQRCNFGDPSLVTFYLCIYLILNEEHFTFHLQYKHSGTFANRKYEELSYPKKSENVRPHSSNSIENATPLQSIQSWKCDPIQRHIPISLLRGSTHPHGPRSSPSPFSYTVFKRMYELSATK